MARNEILIEFVNHTKDILKENLTGIYLHGSAVMGCYNPKKSDLDLIVVVKNSMTDSEKKEIMDMVIDLNEKGPAKGIEMSIVKREVCKPFAYPTPFELHFSVMHLGWYKDNPDDYIRKMNGADSDLAAHFTIIKKRGKCLCGEPIDEVFAEVPKADYMDSIKDDIAEAEDDILDNTMYITLNLARVLAYIKEEKILSRGISRSDKRSYARIRDRRKRSLRRRASQALCGIYAKRNWLKHIVNEPVANKTRLFFHNYKILYLIFPNWLLCDSMFCFRITHILRELLKTHM